MKFQTKMIVTYVMLSVLIACVTGSIYYVVSMTRFMEREYQNLRVTVKQIEQQYDEMIRSMKDVSHYLLSDQETLAAINSISHMESNEKNDIYIVEAKNTIRIQMAIDYLAKKFYRVVFCNENSEPVSNNNWLERQIHPEADFKEMIWYKKAEENPQTFTIIGVHKDTWGKRTNPEVFSVIKKIQGNNMGYIEVQKNGEDVAATLQLANPQMGVCLMGQEGEILYENNIDNPDFCRRFVGKKSTSPGKYEDEKSGSYLVAAEYHQDTGTTVLVQEKTAVIKEGTTSIYVASFLLVGGIMLLSIGYVMIAAKRLTKPMYQLQAVIQGTSLETLEQPFEMPGANNEFQKMAQIYQEMKIRLNKAILREKRLSNLQLQAQFDMLQAQVNPHFLYNVLNVISNRGILNDDEVICDICDDLAGMLRYATDTKEKYATLQRELSFLELYFSLLKYRYEYKLEYKIEVQPQVVTQIIPKLVLQQLVENSITHGYRNSSKMMKITVRVWGDTNNWYIQVKDNGEGFDRETLIELQNQMQKLRSDLTTDRQHVEMKMGGMGILNTYARLYLLNADTLVFSIENMEEGAQITIVAPVR